MTKFRAILELGRVSNLPTVWTNCLAALLLAGGSDFASKNTSGLVWVLVGGTLLYLAGMTLNDAVDADYDREHKADRPIALGAVSPGFVWVLGFVYLVAGSAAFFLADALWGWIAGLVISILLYDFLHKKWIGSVFFMGACRGALVGAALSLFWRDGYEYFPEFSALFVIGGLFLYIVGITVVARNEATGGEPRRWAAFLLFMPCLSMPVAMMVALERVSLAGELLSTPWLVGSVIWLAFVSWTAWTLKILWGDTKGRIGTAVCRLLAGICLIDATMAAAGSLWVAGICVGCFFLTLALQRKISGT